MKSVNYGIENKQVITGNGETVCRCPDRDGQRESLISFEGDKGIALKCHMSCDLESVWAALGIKDRDLF